MTSRARRYLALPLVATLAAIGLSGCVTPEADSIGRYTAPIGDAPVITNDTPYSNALRCFSAYTGRKPLRIAVGQIADYTGKMESDNSGRKLTQGAALMAMSALAKAGVPLVERFDTSVAEMELKYANNKLITDDKQPDQPGDYRKILAGSIPGSNYYLVGGITELNFNIRSVGAQGNAGGTSSTSTMGTAGATLYVMNVGLDMRLVNTDTLEVVDVISYQKQIIGRQEQAGAFSFLGQTFFNVSAGESALEPVQLAVRSVVERGVLEMISRLYHTAGGNCASELGTSADPLAGPGDHVAAAPAAQITTYEDTNHDTSRKDPYHGYGPSDPAAEPRLRTNIE